ncbi:PREDICTED: uncharacterized protein LOC109301980 [Gavialis gangeticus]|uniref:uncharacterized protein LOC109301980 n=1 Tax=Gavialis gangeticus TaxID=94835 RepID=UPI00092F3C66|nr:PREDICTED: uncharacterized protein LOC109301980 [Gavialis gangeticus]
MQLLPRLSLAGKAPGDPGLRLLEKAPQQSTSRGRSLPTLSTMKQLRVCREGSPRETASTFLVRAEKETSAPYLLTGPLSDEAKLGTMAPRAELVLWCRECTRAGGGTSSCGLCVQASPEPGREERKVGKGAKAADPAPVRMVTPPSTAGIAPLPHCCLCTAGFLLPAAPCQALLQGRRAGPPLPAVRPASLENHKEDVVETPKIKALALITISPDQARPPERHPAHKV